MKQKCSGSAVDSVTSSATELSRLTNHPRHHSCVISLRSCDSAEMPVCEADLPPSQVLLIAGFWATLASQTRKQNQSRNFKSHQLVGRDWGIKFSYCQSPELHSSFPLCTSAWGLFILPGRRVLQFKINTIHNVPFKVISFVQAIQILCQFIWRKESIFSFVIKSKFTTKYFETAKLKMSKFIQVVRI